MSGYSAGAIEVAAARTQAMKQIRPDVLLWHVGTAPILAKTFRECMGK